MGIANCDMVHSFSVTSAAPLQATFMDLMVEESDPKRIAIDVKIHTPAPYNVFI